MKTLSENAKGHLDHYLYAVRICLNGCKNVNADEIVRDINDHIETELETATEPVSFDAVDGVLKQLGDPQQWVPVEGMSWWRKFMLRLRFGPEDWRLAYLSFAFLILGLMAGRTFLILFVLASFLLSRSALTANGDDKELGGQKWLIYPSLIVVYLFAGVFLLGWPLAALAVLADELQRAKTIDAFPWNAPDDPHHNAYWTIAILFMSGTTTLWWFIVAVIHKTKPKLIEWLFFPFAGHIRRRWLNIVILIAACLTIACFIMGIVMLNYRG